MSVRDWLDERMLMGVKKDLKRCKKLLNELGDPHLKFKSIHVAGSNGKGSVCVQLSAAARASGKKVGLFTSPHLVTVEERIRIDGEPIPREKFDKFLRRVRKVAEKKPEYTPTYFETTFLVAMLAFEEYEVDRGIIETGMGGEWDATKLVDADLCILTTVSMEHREYLAPNGTLVEIAEQKAAIHRSKVSLFALQHDDPQVRRTIEDTAGDDLSWLPKNQADSTWSSHSVMVEAAAAHLGWEVSMGDCIWPGRSPGYGMDWVEGVVTRLSAAHNAESLANDLAEVDRRSVVLLGLSQKADLRETLEPVVIEICKGDKFPRLVLTETKSGRNPAVSVEELSLMMESMGLGNIPKAVERNPGKAFEMAGEMAREFECELLVIGSVYLIGDLLGYVVDRDGLNLWDELTAH